MSLLSLKTCFVFFSKRAKKCNLLVDLSGFVHWAYEEPTYPAFWLYQVRASNGKLSNIVHLIALPSPLQFDEGQIQHVFAFRCFWWLVMRVQAIYFQIPIPRSEFILTISILFVLLSLLSCHLQMVCWYFLLPMLCCVPVWIRKEKVSVCGLSPCCVKH